MQIFEWYNLCGEIVAKLISKRYLWIKYHVELIWISLFSLWFYRLCFIFTANNAATKSLNYQNDKMTNENLHRIKATLFSVPVSGVYYAGGICGLLQFSASIHTSHNYCPNISVSTGTNLGSIVGRINTDDAWVYRCCTGVTNTTTLTKEIGGTTNTTPKSCEAGH